LSRTETVLASSRVAPVNDAAGETYSVTATGPARSWLVGFLIVTVTLALVLAPATTEAGTLPVTATPRVPAGRGTIPALVTRRARLEAAVPLT
jgi:hypothetical protein